MANTPEPVLIACKLCTKKRGVVETCAKCKSPYCKPCSMASDVKVGEHFRWRLRESIPAMEMKQYHVMVDGKKHKPPFRRVFICGVCYVDTLNEWVAEREEPSSSSSYDESTEEEYDEDDAEVYYTQEENVYDSTDAYETDSENGEEEEEDGEDEEEDSDSGSGGHEEEEEEESEGSELYSSGITDSEEESSSSTK